MRGLYGCDERRLREAKASGDAILARARQLKGLAKANRRRGEARAKERDWTAANSRLEVEREAAERELLATMREMADRRSHQEVHFALEDWRAMCAHARRGARGTWEKAVNLKLSKDAVCHAVKTRDRETAEAIKVFAADLAVGQSVRRRVFPRPTSSHISPALTHDLPCMHAARCSRSATPSAWTTR